MVSGISWNKRNNRIGIEEIGIEELINQKLDEIEQRENVKILYAVESGSRAWGFASPDSDYDVRFVYIRPMEFYLRLEDRKDFINWELNDVLDISGWDLTKVLKHFHKSNVTLYEWSHSPIVYRSTKEWEQIRAVSEQYFSCKAGMYHYYGTANKNYREHLQGELVLYKKYFYVLRPILACQWIEERNSPPPVLFSDLAETMLREDKRELVQRLVEQKKQMSEADRGKRVDKLNEYIEEKIMWYKEKVSNMQDDRNPDWEELNKVFRTILFGGVVL